MTNQNTNTSGLRSILKEISYIGAEDVHGKFLPLCEQVEAHTRQQVEAARVDELEKIKLVTHREEMVRYVDKRLVVLKQEYETGGKDE